MEGTLVIGKLQEIEMIPAKGEMKACAVYKILTLGEKGHVDLVKIKDVGMCLKAKVGDLVNVPVKFQAYNDKKGNACLSCQAE